MGGLILRVAAQPLAAPDRAIGALFEAVFAFGVFQVECGHTAFEETS